MPAGCWSATAGGTDRRSAARARSKSLHRAIWRKRSARAATGAEPAPAAAAVAAIRRRDRQRTSRARRHAPRLRPAAHGELHPARGAGTAPRPDPAAFALLGTVLLMFISATASIWTSRICPSPCSTATTPRSAATTSLNIAGSRYFVEQRADHRLCRSRPAHAHRRTEPRDRDSARLRPGRGARPHGRNRRLDRRRDAVAGGDRARLCPGHARYTG